MSILYNTLSRLLLHPTRIVVIDEHRSWKAAELVLGSFHIADAVARQSDRSNLGIMLPTSGLFPMAAYAGWMLGRTIVPLNYLLKPEDLQHVCEDSEIDTIITVSPMLDFLKSVPRGPRYIRLDTLNFKRPPTLRWPVWNAPEDLAVILYTSGTSGRPKGVMLTHRNIESNIEQCREWAGFDPSDSMLGVLPQFHVFGMTVLTFLPLAYGLRVHYLARFQPRKILRWMARFRPTVFIAIPSMYNALLNIKSANPDDFKSLKYVVSGGEPLPEETANQYRKRFNVIINEGYGLTETSAVSHWCRPSDHRPKSVGRALPGIDVRIAPLDDNDGAQTPPALPPCCDGEIRLAGPNIMRGYYNLPDETKRAFDKDRYFRTGDIGHLDDDGFLYITGRLKEMMIIGGENVFPRDIEEVLNRHPSVHDSAVIGVRDPSRGEIPIAFVEIAEGAEFNEAEFRTHCRNGLPQYKVPREIHAVGELPRNPTGKILRRMLTDPNPDR